MLQVKSIPEHFCYTISLLFILDKSKYHNFCLCLCPVTVKSCRSWIVLYSIGQLWNTACLEVVTVFIFHHSSLQQWPEDSQNQEKEFLSYLKLLRDSTLYFSRSPLSANETCQRAFRPKFVLVLEKRDVIFLWDIWKHHAYSYYLHLHSWISRSHVVLSQM